jgi:hypothetical protein
MALFAIATALCTLGVVLARLELATFEHRL